MTGHIFNNTGTFTGATLIQGSVLRDLSITLGAAPAGGAAEAERERLRQALEALRAMLTALPPERAEDANLLIEDTRRLVTEAAKPAPDRGKLARFGSTVRDAAKDLLDAAPKVLDTINGIVDLVQKITGTP